MCVDLSDNVVQLQRDRDVQPPRTITVHICLDCGLLSLEAFDELDEADYNHHGGNLSCPYKGDHSAEVHYALICKPVAA